MSTSIVCKSKAQYFLVNFIEKSTILRLFSHLNAIVCDVLIQQKTVLIALDITFGPICCKNIKTLALTRGLHHNPFKSVLVFKPETLL